MKAKTQGACRSGILLSALILWAVVWGVSAAEQPSPGPSHGDMSVEATSGVDMFKMERDREAIPRDYVQQPPLIPHNIKGYNITKNFNKCMDCHSWTRYKETGATKVSLTHFRDRDGKELTNISPRRYFCLQCHVPQTDAPPLVKNTFKPVPTVKN